MLGLPPISAVAIPEEGQHGWMAPDLADLRSARYHPRRLWQVRTLDDAKIKATGAYLILQSGSQVQVLDAASGRLRLNLTDCAEYNDTIDPYMIRDLLLVVRNSAIEAWSAKTGKRRWSVPCGKKGRLGSLAQDSLYFTDEAGLHRVATPSGHALDALALRFPDGARSGTYMTPNRLLVNFDGHELGGLQLTDLSRGWWFYCDPWRLQVENSVVYGTSWGFHAFAIADSGTLLWNTGPQTAARLYFQRESFAITPSVCVYSGIEMAASDVALSPYLFGLSKKTGAVVWKKPVAVQSVAVMGSKVVTLAGHRGAQKAGWSPYGAAVDGMERRLEIREPSNGRLLWRSQLLPASQGRLNVVADRTRFFVLSKQSLTAFR